MTENEPLQLASEYIHHTSRNVFLTGKAGTGKTTFLQSLRTSVDKRMAIVAPTGVAAINAGGVTIHSFFQLPFGPHIPGSLRSNAAHHKMSRERINVIRSLDLLVIDEISMVRSDLLDGIDEVLRRYRHDQRPFGGIQLLMIGDLNQLPPVIKDAEWSMLNEHYATPYFFSSLALGTTRPVRIELTKIFRQADDRFISILNQVRDNKLEEANLKILNERYIKDFDPEEGEGYITLMAKNEPAQKMNRAKLEALDDYPEFFDAVVDGDFPESAFPTDQKLELKNGAQVMFIKNDTSQDKQFYNGKIGKIVGIEDDAIRVRCTGEYADIVVRPLEWQNVKYAMNPESREVEEQVIGSFRQYPLKLAWAITIHKSQGLTFENVIIDVSDSFAHGQVYVALSRCKSLEGIVLLAPVQLRNIKTDGTVAAYTRDAVRESPGSSALNSEKQSYHKALQLELFDFSAVEKALFRLSQLSTGIASILDETSQAWLGTTVVQASEKVFVVAARFRSQLMRLQEQPQPDDAVKERLVKAVGYFVETMQTLFGKEVHELETETDNKVLQTSAQEAIEQLQKACFIKKACLEVSKESFDTARYLRARSNADVDFRAPLATPGKSKHPALSHGSLYDALKKWRKDVSSERDMVDYKVLPIKTMMEIAQKKPLNAQALGSIKGFGKTRLKTFGGQILDLINEHMRKGKR